MQKMQHTSNVTFAVDKVTPATQPLPECRTHEAIRAMLDGIESCHDYHGTVIKGIYYQPLLAAVYTAFSQHRPLVLTPDAVWITIAQGVAHHMVIHGERLRSRFVAHEGKLDLMFVCRDWVEGSPENPWNEAFESWTGQIREHVGCNIHDTLICDFSTSGTTERVASQIVMLDIFERYFHYVLYCVCGIPTITLEGTTSDWQRLADKVASLKVFELDWWLDHLYPICEQFIRASRGDVDEKHWQSICKRQEAYGGDIINGWIAKLFPYLRSFTDGPCNKRNPIFETGEGFQTCVAPSGLSRVPFTWQEARTNRQRAMEVVGGLVGVIQHKETLALQPKIGWAVREAEKMDVLLARLSGEHTTFPRIKLEDNRGLPSDLCKFYHSTNGAEIFGCGDSASYRVVAIGDLTPLDWGEQPEEGGNSRGPEGRIWHRFAWLPDRSWLAINLDYNKHLAPWWNDQKLRKLAAAQGDSFAPICHTASGTKNKPGLNPVVALSFTELLERLLDKGDRPYWLDPCFVGYGDAELYTRRN